MTRFCARGPLLCICETTYQFKYWLAVSNTSKLTVIVQPNLLPSNSRRHHLTHYTPLKLDRCVYLHFPKRRIGAVAFPWCCLAQERIWQSTFQTIIFCQMMSTTVWQLLWFFTCSQSKPFGEHISAQMAVTGCYFPIVCCLSLIMSVPSTWWTIPGYNSPYN